jgi:hypothetical protein
MAQISARWLRIVRVESYLTNNKAGGLCATSWY